MNTPSSPATTGPILPSGQTQTSFNSVFVQVELFVFNPNIVTAFLHRKGPEGSVPVTEIVYESHCILVEDPDQRLFFYLRGQLRPNPAKTSL